MHKNVWVTASLLTRILYNLQTRPVFWAMQEIILQICFSKVNFSLSVTSRSLRELETSKSSPHKVNGEWGG